MTAHESRMYNYLVTSYRWLIRAKLNAEACLRQLDTSDAALAHYLTLGLPDAKARDVRAKIKALKEAVEVGSTLSGVFLELLGPEQPRGRKYRNPWVGEPPKKRKRPAHGKRRARPRRA